jgi:phosphoglycerate dehydrogenase-like enzyme
MAMTPAPPVKALHFAPGAARIAPAFFDAVERIPGLALTRVTNWEEWPAAELLRLLREHDLLIASRAPRLPDELGAQPGRLKYICYLHGTMRKAIGLPIIRSPIAVTNWGDSPGPDLAQNSLMLLLAVFRDLPKRIMAVRRGGGRDIVSMGADLARLRVGIYGFGFAGREFARLLRVFGCRIAVFDPYVEQLPDGCVRAASLRELFTTSQAIVIHAGLTDETRHSVTRALLALLPDQGIVINTARGAIIDQEALFDELRAGRLRAGLDVLWPDELPADHEARQWENLIWTCHECAGKPWPEEGEEGILEHYRVALKNIRAFVEGRPLEFVVDETRYMRMT